MPIVTFPLGMLEANCHLVHNQHDALVIDPGGENLEGVLAYLKEHGLNLVAIVDTHMHFDHVTGNASLSKATGAPIYAAAKDQFLVDANFQVRQWEIPPIPDFDYNPLDAGGHDFASLSVVVLETPGHTPGSLSLYIPDENAVLTGDLLFAHSVGRTDFPQGSSADLTRSLREKIYSLPPETVVYPGHGPNTTVGEEALHNPYCVQK